ncbi:MAG TPA: fumarylacetoacetate hydrolase family protein [Acidimicrobiales bacterium]|jgi:2-keto-4-pentenoate hydratase/2-oxohepta-3-ene-1,7-dioic acid hydratase in catechol pathway|nr:fumarylacetoacetate hydrolase family protein [Acidimicrobiales bacterium]
MRLVTYRSSGDQVVAVVDAGERLHDLNDLLGVRDLVELIARWDEVADRVRQATADSSSAGAGLGEAELLAPIPRPRRNVFAVGKNYREHAREFGASGYDQTSGGGPNGGDDVPTKPVVFTKPPTSVIGPDQTIERHAQVTSELDYEAELGVIIGRGGRDIAAGDAVRHIWGYTAVNDVTARDRQRDHRQWFLGKGLDTFCPMGPVAVTSDEIDGSALEITCHVNGELRQKASTSEMVFDIPTLIETISAGLTLEPGDVIATGTPAGVGVGFQPPRFLQSGDVVEVTITGIGTLRNRVG